jgi:hypothetical protein
MVVDMKTRVAGLLYLLPMILGPFSMLFVPAQVLVPNDAGATLEHLRASASLFRLGLLSDLLIVVTEVALTALLFGLFARCSQALSLVAAGARLTMAAVQGANVMLLLGAQGAAAHHDATLVLTLLEVHGQAVHVWEGLFALHCLALAALVFRSGVAPRVFGPLLGLAGVGYALNGFGSLAWPSVAPALSAVVGFTALVGEVPFVFWLLVHRPANGRA